MFSSIRCLASRKGNEKRDQRYALRMSEQADQNLNIKPESLILAQDERWRQA